jgi:hypothetical protein
MQVTKQVLPSSSSQKRIMKHAYSKFLLSKASLFHTHKNTHSHIHIRMHTNSFINPPPLHHTKERAPSSATLTHSWSPPMSLPECNIGRELVKECSTECNTKDCNTKAALRVATQDKKCYVLPRRTRTCYKGRNATSNTNWYTVPTKEQYK